jgi:hypothetical protein
MTDAKIPQAHAVLMQIDTASRRSDAPLWIVSRCPFCGKRHTHAGGRSGADPRTILGRHTAPCKQGDYTLVDIASLGL